MAAGDPTGPDLASGTVNGDSLPELWTQTQDTKLTFGAGTALTSGVKYAIVVRSTGAGSANRGVWQMKTSGEYAGGQRLTSNDSGSSWSGDNVDCWFKTYTGAGFNVLRDSYNPAWEASVADFYDTYWTAQTFTATSSYTITAVNLELGRVAGGLPGTITASIKAVGGPGKATNPAPTDDQEGLLIAGKDRLLNLTWDAPSGETPDYLVYFRAEGGAWVLYDTITDDSTGYTLSSTILDAFSYYSIYEWRVDTREGGVTTTGDTWTFITQVSSDFTNYTRRSDYDADKVWQPGTGWVDPNTFEFAGGGQYKEQVVAVGHKVIYFGDL